MFTALGFFSVTMHVHILYLKNIGFIPSFNIQECVDLFIFTSVLLNQHIFALSI